MSTGAEGAGVGPKDERLLAAAEALVDGAGVDSGERGPVPPELAGPLAELRSLQRLADACHGAGAPGDGPRVARWGELELREKLGEGGFGEVWRAWDPSLQREVALKLARTGAGAGRRGVLDEARRLARVHHPHVIAIHGVDVRHDRAGLWMELVEGRTLERELAERGVFGAREVAAVGLDLCAALAAVHASGLVHGDVKPANVMRERGGRIVLMDFGSGARSGVPSDDPLTATPFATAPEVLAGAAPDARSDVWSLGALLFRLLTARWPVEAESLEALRAAHAGGPPASLRLLRPGLPAPLVAAIERALAADPARRFADVGALERALGGIARPGAGGVTGRRAFGVVALLLAALAAWTLWPRPAPRPAPTGGVAGGMAPGVAGPLPAPRFDGMRLRRVRDGRAETLQSGALVRLGDELWLETTCPDSAWVYVLNEDDHGAVFALFPVAGTELRNPLAPGLEHELPGARAGRAMHWQISTPATRERFLVVASRQPLEALERLVASLAPARADAPLAYAEVDGPVLATLRGAGRLRPATPSIRRDSRLQELAAALAGGAGVWVREYDFGHER